jgi:hypothetical protein
MDRGFQIPDSRFQIPDSKFKNPDSRIQKSRIWRISIGYLLLGAFLKKIKASAALVFSFLSINPASHSIFNIP